MRVGGNRYGLEGGFLSFLFVSMFFSQAPLCIPMRSFNPFCLNISSYLPTKEKVDY